MSGIRSVVIKPSYYGKGTKILESFLLPLLEEATTYDRVTSFYTIDSLLAISQGVQSLYERHGRMRLIIGVHSFPTDLADAVLRKDFFENQIAQVRADISGGLETIRDALTRRRLATLAWMIEDGLLEVKAASVAGGEGIFHAKTLLIGDQSGDKVVAVGSPNETPSGLGGNFEQLMVQKSWETPDGVAEQQRFFDSLWENREADAVVMDVTSELANTLMKSLGECTKTVSRSHPIKPDGVLSLASQMPSEFFVSGHVPALYQHQERAVIEALSRWPIRVLFADEVGLGKTFEAGATIAFLTRYCGVRRVLILSPKSVLLQWQKELHDHFGIDAWVYVSSSKRYEHLDKEPIEITDGSPLGNSLLDLD